jgi:glycosyltransferase involved in cell wall biosynthesis
LIFAENSIRGKLFRTLATLYADCFSLNERAPAKRLRTLLRCLDFLQCALDFIYKIRYLEFTEPRDTAHIKPSAGLAKRFARKLKTTLRFCVKIFLPQLKSRWRSEYLLQIVQTKKDRDSALGFAYPPGWLASLMPKVFDRYDVIIGYATDGCWPLATGKTPYCAFEHGTIRSIPFEDSYQGNLCAATYQNADYVFITNCDNIIAAKRLELQHFCFLPHPINEDIPGYINPRELRKRLNAIHPADFWLFHPARHHWDEERHPSWEKGNDRLIHGMAEAIKKHGCKLGAVFVDWGRDVAKSRALLEELGIADCVVWIDPMPHPLMVEYLLATDFCADQFHLGAFGSTAPKALYHKRPVLIYLDEERHRWCLPEMPPMVNVKEPGEIAVALGKLCLDGEYRRTVAEKGRSWYDMYHSNKVIGDTLERVLSDLCKKDRGEE